MGHDLEPELGLDSWGLRRSDSGGASPNRPLGTAHARRLVREDLEFRDGRLGLLVSAQGAEIPDETVRIRRIDVVLFCAAAGRR